jgi:DNA modification methylase
VGRLIAKSRHRVKCGDSTIASDLKILMNGELADFCFTSPPYGVGLDYGKYEDTFENCKQTVHGVAGSIWSVLRDGGICQVNFGDIISGRAINGTEIPSEYPMALVYFPAFSEAGFALNSRRVWAKPHARVAAPWTANSNRSASDWEHLWTFIKPGPFLNERRNPSYLGVWDTTTEKEFGTKQGVEVGKDQHPAAFPVVVVRMALAVYSNEDDLVFEPFLGTGTTLIGAETDGRRCVAMELSEAYTDMAVKRWMGFTGQVAILESTGEAFNG